MATDNYGDSASGFTIKELGGQKRTLSFTGRALPYRPFSLSGTMRAEFTYYPGNPIGTVQVLGAAESDTSINGVWKDRFLRQIDDDGESVVPDGTVTLDGGDQTGATNMLADVEAIVNAVDDIRMQGQLLEVSWDTRVRHGILKEFKQTWLRHEVCEWEMHFGWISRGEAQLPINFASQPSFSSAKISFSDVLNGLKDALKEGLAIYSSYAAKVASYVNAVSDAVDSIDNTLTAFVTVTQSFADSAHRMLAIFDTIKDDAIGLRNLVQSAPAATVYATADILDVTFGDALGVSDWNNRIKGFANQLLSLAVQQEDAIQATLDEQEVLDVFDARDDMDLRDVSTQYYGTPDQWKALMSYNGLTTSKLSAGMEIMIPKLRTGGQT